MSSEVSDSGYLNLQTMNLLMYCKEFSNLVPKAGLEPARISTVDFESTASTDFATSALKRYAENVVNYTCHAPPCKRQLARTSLSAEIFSIAYRDV